MPGNGKLTAEQTILTEVKTQPVSTGWSVGFTVAWRMVISLGTRGMLRENSAASAVPAFSGCATRREGGREVGDAGKELRTAGVMFPSSQQSTLPSSVASLREPTP